MNFKSSIKLFTLISLSLLLATAPIQCFAMKRSASEFVKVGKKKMKAAADSSELTSSNDVSSSLTGNKGRSTALTNIIFDNLRSVSRAVGDTFPVNTGNDGVNDAVNINLIYSTVKGRKTIGLATDNDSTASGGEVKILAIDELTNEATCKFTIKLENVKKTVTTLSGSTESRQNRLKLSGIVKVSGLALSGS